MAKKRRKTAKKKKAAKKTAKKTVSRKRKVKRSSWSRGEVAQLRRLFARNSTKSVAKELRRSVKSVGQKASRLGLKKTKRYMKSLGRA